MTAETLTVCLRHMVSAVLSITNLYYFRRKVQDFDLLFTAIESGDAPITASSSGTLIGRGSSSHSPLFAIRGWCLREEIGIIFD